MMEVDYKIKQCYAIFAYQSKNTKKDTDTTPLKKKKFYLNCKNGQPWLSSSGCWDKLQPPCDTTLQ